MPYNFSLTVFTQKKLCSMTFFKQSAILDGNRPFCVFDPPFGGLGATYDVHLELIGKLLCYFFR